MEKEELFFEDIFKYLIGESEKIEIIYDYTERYFKEETYVEYEIKKINGEYPYSFRRKVESLGKEGLKLLNEELKRVDYAFRVSFLESIKVDILSLKNIVKDDRIVYEENEYGPREEHNFNSFTKATIKTAIDSISVSEMYGLLFLKIYLDTSSVTYKQYSGNFLLLAGKTPVLTTENSIFSTWNQFIQPQPDGSYMVYLDKQTFTGPVPFQPPYYITVATFNSHVGLTEFPGLDTKNYSGYIDPETGHYVYPSIKMAPNTVYVQ